MKEKSMEKFINGLIELCNQTGYGIQFHITQFGAIPEGKTILYFGRDDDMNIIPVLGTIDLDKLIHIPDEQ